MLKRVKSRVIQKNGLKQSGITLGGTWAMNWKKEGTAMGGGEMGWAQDRYIKKQWQGIDEDNNKIRKVDVG